MSKLGVSALIPALLAVASVSNLGGKVLEDGKVDLGDLGTVIGSLGDLSGLASIKVGQAFHEALDLDESERKEVIAAFKAKFDLPADAAEEGVELLVDGALHGLVGYAKGKAGAALLGLQAAD